MAEENARAGEHLIGRSRIRAATSRFYYAAYHAAHAILYTTPLLSSVPDRGNWDHGPLINAVKDAALRHMGYDGAASERLRRLLVSARDARVVADYGAGYEVTGQSLRSAQKAATQFIALAYRHGARSQ